MLTAFIIAFVIIFMLLTLLWLVSVKLKNASIVDLFWGLGFVIINAVYFLNAGSINTRKILLLFLVTVWGLRLTLYLSFRNIGQDEDFRYREFRQKYGPDRYWWLSYFQVFLLQGVLMMLVSLTLLGANMETFSEKLYWIDYIAVLLWVIGFVFEAGGDMQLTRFKKDPKNKGKLLDTGFWKYTRHPNYFGDAAVWWSFALFSVAAGGYWHIIGAMIMTVLLIKVSGVSLLEKTLSRSKPHYHDYIKKTSAFFPWFPRKINND